MPDERDLKFPLPPELAPDDRSVLRRHIIVFILRVTAAIVLILGTYAMMPVDRTDWNWVAIPFIVAGLILFGWIFVRQLERVSNSDFPMLRAVEALVLTFLLFLVMFAAIAVQIEGQTPGSYSEALSKPDGFYFSVTTMATVGFGDITPVTTVARVIVTVQMLGNLILLGVAVRAIGQAVARGREAGRGARREVPTDGNDDLQA